MNRQLPLKIVLALVKIIFLALAYPMVIFMRQDPAMSMIFSVYATPGVFLLLAIRNPVGEPQPDRLHGVAQFCSRRVDGHSGMVQHGCAGRVDSSGRSGGHRRGLDRACAGEAAGRMRRLGVSLRG